MWKTAASDPYAQGIIVTLIASLRSFRRYVPFCLVNLIRKLRGDARQGQGESRAARLLAAKHRPVENHDRTGDLRLDVGKPPEGSGGIQWF